MACQTRPGTAPYLHFLSEVTEMPVTQADWHAIRKLAEADHGAKLTRAVADVDHAADAVLDLAHALSDEGGIYDPEESVEARNECYDTVQVNCATTEGTLVAIRYLTKNGPRKVLQQVAEARKPVKVDPEQAKWAIHDAAMDEAEPMKDRDLLDAIDAANAGLDRLPKYHADRSPEQREQWFRDYNRMGGLMAVARDRGLIDSHGQRYDADGYTPVFENSEHISIDGTSKVDDIDGVTYNDLVAAFGEPTVTGDIDKVQAMWMLEFETPDGPAVTTIYDWKTGHDDVRSNTLWSIGGKRGTADWSRRYVRKAMGLREDAGQGMSPEASANYAAQMRERYAG